MLWVESDDYVGPDRRRRGDFRLIDRRRSNLAREAPSLAVLLRQLSLQTLDVRLGDGATLAKCLARIDAITALARDRSETGAALWLEALAGKIRRTHQSRVRAEAGDIIAHHVQCAMAALK
jgi:hypothetical protein